MRSAPPPSRCCAAGLALSPLSTEALLQHAGCHTGWNISMCLPAHDVCQGWALYPALDSHHGVILPQSLIGPSGVMDGPDNPALHLAQTCSEALHTGLVSRS